MLNLRNESVHIYLAAVVVGFGRTCPEGHLPVFNVGSEAEASLLITMTCETNIMGLYVARELAEEQTIETLEKFSERIAMMHDTYLRGTDRCDCTGEVNG